MTTLHRAPAATKPFTLAPHEGEQLLVVGDHVRILADGASSGNTCFIFEDTTPPGAGPPLHVHHRDDEYFYILQGRAKFVIDGRELTLGPGAFVHAPKHTSHTFVSLGPEPLKMLLICIGAGLEHPFREADALAKKQPLTPESLTAIFAKHDLEFIGPPLKP